MGRFRKAFRAFWVIYTGGLYSYADQDYCFIYGSAKDIVGNINSIADLATDEINKNEVLKEAKDLLNA